MRDFNFFEPYMDKKGFKIEEKLIYYFIIIALSLSLLSYMTYNQIRIRRLSDEIAKLKSVAEDELTNRKYEEIREVEEQTEELGASLEEVKDIDARLRDEVGIIDDLLLKAITSRIPEDLFFSSMNMHSDNIEIIGVAQDRQTIAELGRSLEMIEKFKEVFISSISKEDLYYRFNLSINLKDVSEDEEAEEIEDSKTDEGVE
ncbi:MAG: PilN domain-containing protein [Tissierellia bacterium]|nr:PilN domain-containing protein [Tissierellia bacterium]